MAFHIALSNVPVNYAYSLFVGLICENANIIRIPSKDFPQVGMINNSIRTILESYQLIKLYICLVRYIRDKEINDRLTGICDSRIIWGVNEIIAELRTGSKKEEAKRLFWRNFYRLVKEKHFF